LVNIVDAESTTCEGPASSGTAQGLCATKLCYLFRYSLLPYSLYGLIN
jgi:hypothetical protein